MAFVTHAGKRALFWLRSKPFLFKQAFTVKAIGECEYTLPPNTGGHWTKSKQSCLAALSSAAG